MQPGALQPADVIPCGVSVNRDQSTAVAAGIGPAFQDAFRNLQGALGAAAGGEHQQQLARDLLFGKHLRGDPAGSAAGGVHQLKFGHRPVLSQSIDEGTMYNI